jgi:Zn-dependent metalloprotease
MPRTRLAASAVVVALAATAAGLQSTGAASAADGDGVVTSTRPLAATSSLATSAVKTARSLSGIGDAAGLEVKDAWQDSTGATHVRMNRTYRGLRVVGGDVVVHRDRSGTLLGTSRSSTRALTLSTTPTVSAASVTSTMSRTEGKPELVVDALGGNPRLAWLVTTGGTQADGTPSRLEHYVDARTGRTLRTEQTIETVQGDGHSLYLGTVPLDLTRSGTSYQLKSTSHGGTYTSTAGNQTDGTLCSIINIGCATSTLYTSPDTTFGTGSTSSGESAAVDAQRGSDLTWDYYQSTFGRNGIFGTGKGSYNRVHYGTNYVNAFWDGTKMTYGDGDGTSYGPLVSVDVTGHEMSHGVTENTAGLTYSGESGGLNEATSDIFGTMVEFYANDPSDPGDYLIGEQFDLKKHLGLRRMDDPASDGVSQSCWSADTKNVDVHYSSGVGNHLFYLLSEGSGAKTLNGVSYSSPTCNGSAVTGIGRDAAAAIWYRALTVYFTSGTTYAQARTATLSAAKDLYGAGSSQYDAVGTAWSAVNVA